MEKASDKVVRKAERERKMDLLKKELESHRKKTGEDVLGKVASEKRSAPVEDMAKEYMDLVEECKKEGDPVPAEHEKEVAKAKAPKKNRNVVYALVLLAVVSMAAYFLRQWLGY